MSLIPFRLQKMLGNCLIITDLKGKAKMDNELFSCFFSLSCVDSVNLCVGIYIEREREKEEYR